MEEKKEMKEEAKAAEAAAGAEAHEEEAHEEGGKFLRNRRQFLGAFVGIIGAVGAAEICVPLLGSFTPVQRGKPEPVTIDMADLPEGGMLQKVYGGSPFIAFNRKTGIECISLVCSHLGCLVKYDEGKEEFKCPCHDGGFDKNGKQKYGPPPAPLEQLTYKLVGEKLIVGGE